MRPTGFFVGMTTVDLQYLVDALPAENAKRKAERFGLSTGGPATNAAVAFAYLGGQSSLCSVIGEHAFTPFMREELEGLGVDVVDLAPGSGALPPFSSIITTKSSGERSVVAYSSDQGAGANNEMADINVGDFDIVLLDGFQMAFAQSIAAQAKKMGVPVLLDGGSWKEGMDSLLKHVGIAICSADFRPPGSHADSEPREILDYLAASGVTHSAITRGEKPILWYDGETYGEVPVEQVQVVDTLGAGDIFHGAFCYYYPRLKEFEAALRKAARVAGRSCGFLGTRAWMEAGNNS